MEKVNYQENELESVQSESELTDKRVLRVAQPEELSKKDLPPGA